MKKIVILGGGESGVGAAILAKKHGYTVFLSDKGVIKDCYKKTLIDNDIDFEDKNHSVDKILSADEIIKSPGIPNTAPLIVEAEKKGIKIISEIEFASRYDKSVKICITGSNGKTTTTSLIYHILKTKGFNVGLGGNIGMSYAYQVATQNHDYYVLEISSFQLDNCYEFKPDVAVLTNITPDHLDRYDHKLENYARAKFRITQKLDSNCTFIYDVDDPVTINTIKDYNISAKCLKFSITNEKADAYIHDNKIVTKEKVINLRDIKIKGRHNMYNAMAASLACISVGLSSEDIEKGLASFEAIEHRLEFVANINGVTYINDSKATNTDSAWYALDAQKQPIIWIVGGTDKGNDYTPLLDLAKNKVRAIVCLGVDNIKIHKSFEKVVDTIVDTKSAIEAVKTAESLAQKGDVVLLSPCCASFDLFKNYEDRGKQFKEAVKNL